MKRLTTTLIVLLLAVISGTAGAVVSDFLPIQGIMTDPETDDPINGAVNATFSIYNTAEGGVPLWTETHDGDNQLDVQDGLFSVYLGKVEPLDLSLLLSEAELYIGITIGATEMQPRLEIASGMFSMESQSCSMADSFDVAFELTVTGGVVVGGTVTAGGELGYASEKTGVLSISAAAFHPTSSVLECQFSPETGLSVTNDIGAQIGVAAPFYLPNGVTMTSFSSTAYRKMDTEFHCHLGRARADTVGSAQTVDDMAVVTFEVESEDNQTLTTGEITHPVVDNWNNAYYIFCIIGHDSAGMAGLHGVRVEYTYSTLSR